MSKADIYALIEHIDSKGTDITEAEWLLLAALCNSGTGGEWISPAQKAQSFTGCSKRIRPKPIYDPDGIRK